MIVVYLATPYSADDDWQKWLNITYAHMMAYKIWMAGMTCISPISNTAWMGGCIEEQIFLRGDFELIKRSDAIFMNEGWEKSLGCCAEYKHAGELGIPIFVSLKSLTEWAKRGKESKGQ